MERTLKVLFLSPHTPSYGFARLARFSRVRLLSFEKKIRLFYSLTRPLFYLIYLNARDLIPLGLVHSAVKRALEGLTPMGVGIKSSPGSKRPFLIPASYFALVVSGNEQKERVTLPADSSSACIYMKKTMTPFPEPRVLTHALIVSPLTELTQLDRLWTKVRPARRVTLPSQKGNPDRWVTLLAEPTFSFSCERFARVRKCMKNWLAQGISDA